MGLDVFWRSGLSMSRRSEKTVTAVKAISNTSIKSQSIESQISSFQTVNMGTCF